MCECRFNALLNTTTPVIYIANDSIIPRPHTTKTLISHHFKTLPSPSPENDLMENVHNAYHLAHHTF